MEITSVILKPKLTEKTQLMRGFSSPKLSFLVHPKATKNQIRNAFILLFGVKPSSLNTILRKPSRTRFTRRSRYNYTKLQKIAYITVSSSDLETLQKKIESASAKEG